MRLFLERLEKAPMALWSYREGSLYQFYRARLFRHRPLDVYLRWFEAQTQLILLGAGKVTDDEYSPRDIMVIAASTGHDAQFALERDRQLRIASAKESLSKFGVEISDIVGANYIAVPDRDRHAIVMGVQEIARVRFGWYS